MPSTLFAAADVLSDAALEAALFPPALAAQERVLPDWAAVDQELRRHKHVTRKLLWMEYKAADPDGLGFSQFKQRLSDWQKASGRGLSMRQVHHAGETLQVDYAGDTVPIVDPHTGEVRAAQIFVAAAGGSSYAFAEATWSQELPCWITSHVRMLEFYGGCFQIVVPDNLRSGVTTAKRARWSARF